MIAVTIMSLILGTIVWFFKITLPSYIIATSNDKDPPLLSRIIEETDGMGNRTYFIQRRWMGTWVYVKNYKRDSRETYSEEAAMRKMEMSVRERKKVSKRTRRVIDESALKTRTISSNLGI